MCVHGQRGCPEAGAWQVGGKEAEDKVREVDRGQMCKVLWAKVVLDFILRAMGACWGVF